MLLDEGLAMRDGEIPSLLSWSCYILEGFRERDREKNAGNSIAVIVPPLARKLAVRKDVINRTEKNLYSSIFSPFYSSQQNEFFPRGT